MRSNETFFKNVLGKRIIAVRDRHIKKEPEYFDIPTPQKPTTSSNAGDKTPSLKKSQSSGSNTSNKAPSRTGSNTSNKAQDDRVTFIEPPPIEEEMELRNQRNVKENLFRRRSQEYIDGDYTDEEALFNELDTTEKEITEITKKMGKRLSSKKISEAKEKHEKLSDELNTYLQKVNLHDFLKTERPENFNEDEYNKDLKQMRKVLIATKSVYVDLYLNL